MRARIFTHLILPLITNAALAIVAFWFMSDRFVQEPAVCFLVASAGAISALTVVVGFVAGDIAPIRALFALVGQALCLIVIFAGIYRGFGLHDRVVLHADAILAPQDALYFSIVTWTTLGYGDLQPAERLQLLAGMEAVLGYVFLGLIVGAMANLADQRPQPNSARE